jgi:RimJ/RimL family protein N-acetyltransferase
MISDEHPVDNGSQAYPDSSTRLGLPIFEGRLGKLRPLAPPDHQALYAIAIDDGINFRWRFRGIVPNFDQFVQSLHQNDLLAQFVVCGLRTPQPVGMVVAYGADPRNSFAHVGAIVAPKYGGRGIGAEAVVLFMQYLFQNWPFRKLYFDVVEFNLAQFASISKVGNEEGRLKEHTYFDGRYWDNVILAVHRDQFAHWVRKRGRLVDANLTDGAAVECNNNPAEVAL